VAADSIRMSILPSAPRRYGEREGALNRSSDSGLCSVEPLYHGKVSMQRSVNLAAA
jgi:hypothetical protein